jgi:hypothetical protein
MNEQAFSNRDFAIRTHIDGIGRFTGKMVRGVLQFVKTGIATHDAACRVAHLAERYYAMNASELADIGLTPDQIPAELRRALCG